VNRFNKRKKILTIYLYGASSGKLISCCRARKKTRRIKCNCSYWHNKRKWMEKLHFPHFCQPYNKNNKTFTNTNYASASRKVYIHAHKKNQGRYL